METKPLELKRLINLLIRQRSMRETEPSEFFMEFIAIFIHQLNNADKLALKLVCRSLKRRILTVLVAYNGENLQHPDCSLFDRICKRHMDPYHIPRLCLIEPNKPKPFLPIDCMIVNECS
jgi:hypothetical protein